MKKMKWLSEKPKMTCGVTWGVPWKKGELKKGNRLSLVNENAERQYVQSEPSAYWPDGSIKWTKHAAVFGGQEHQSFAVQKGESPQPTEVLRINESEHDIQVNTGTLVCAIHKTGSDFIQSLQINGKPIAAGGSSLP